ncbi:hypothetical protein [Alcanivorax sp.]|uniref:glycosyltransferase n=1 Tax=Alcanivorax sp. TaxID=1872427 RepID=UPI000C0EA948|nr:hypothetical protein [Alcanivorax sp.]PHR67321.1 MAG: hypothetical protein COA55_07185 [Alcanivorax sp.]
MMRVPRKPEVFIGPMEIAGIASGLENGFHQLGVSARVCLAYPHPYGYSSSSPKGILAAWQKAGSKVLKYRSKRTPVAAFWLLWHKLLSWPVLFFSLFRFNTFIFLFAQTITNTEFELWILKRLRKTVVFIYSGTESRPPYINGGFFPAGGDAPDLLLALKMTRKVKRVVRRNERYADYTINSPSTAQFQEKPFINWFSIGIPKTIPVVKAYEKKEGKRSIKIVHSPSHPVLKGSALIEECVGRMRAKGYQIDFVRLEGVSNDEVLDALTSCDFVIDQLYSDTPMAVLATEAAFFAKPSVVGGYFSQDVSEMLAEEDLPPSCFVMPEALDAAVERLIVDNDYRQQLGMAAQSFVLKKWNSLAVAERYLQLISGDVPADWWFDPINVRYSAGCGMPDYQAARMIGLMVDRFGTEALQLEDKPRLRDLFLAMSKRRQG